MSDFQGPIDIWNTALQHCGAKLIASYNEISKNHTETTFCYDKLRKAELQRSYWSFAIKRAILRAVNSNTMQLAPSLWSPTTTYFVGSIVTDENGTLWESIIPNNLANDPLLTTFWQPYCGPLGIPLWDSTDSTSYFVGEMVYTAPGDGTYNVYRSMIDSNADDPSIVSMWLSTSTYYKNQVTTFYPNWVVGTTYAQGAVVTQSGINYVSLAAGNIGNNPSSVPTKWLALSLTASNAIQASEWSSTGSYTANTIIAYRGVLYLAIATSTGAIPSSSPSSWTAFSGGVAYQSLIDLNIGNEPDLAPALWASGTTYSTGQQIGGSDGIIYQSVSNGNIGNNPVGDGGVHWTNTGVLNPWTTVFTAGSGSVNWLLVGGSAFPSGVALVTPNIIYPMGTGPATQFTTRNVYILPGNYLRKAPQNPKKGVPYLGGPTGVTFSDWLIEGPYLTTWSKGPFVFRFVADITDVTRMHDMFCEGVALRVAINVVQPITQSGEKAKEVAGKYQKWMTEARDVDFIEEEYVDPPDDDWISCRY